MFPLQTQNGIAWQGLQSVLRTPAFKWGKTTVRQCGKEPTHLIIGIGQLHPVLRGTFEAFQARRIASVQLWIFTACNTLISILHTSYFGKEGFGSKDGVPTAARLSPQSIVSLQRALQEAGDPRILLHRAAKKWRKALRCHRIDDIQEAMRMLDALSLLQAVHAHIGIFPLERTATHGMIHKTIDAVQERIARIESSANFQSAKTKHGRMLSEEEARMVRERNTLVRSFNSLLKNAERDQTIFDAVLGRSRADPVTVFVLGQGHRDSLLRLAKHHLPNDTLFAWITPPQLWLWRAVLQWLGWLLLSCALALLVWLGLR